MSTYSQSNRRELQERILFLELTLAALQAQLASRDMEASEEIMKARLPENAAFQETPLAIAAG